MSTRRPWTYGNNVKDRAYLGGDQLFKDLVQEISDALEHAPLGAVQFELQPAKTDLELVNRKCKRGSWYIQLDIILLDRFFNGKMGIRAQYYESPEHGHSMNRLLLNTIEERLFMFAVAKDPTVDMSILRLSLSAESAKAWVSEKNLCDQRIIGFSAPSLVEDELRNDWLDVAREVQCGEYGPTHRSALNGVRAPLADQLEIKGAWITELDRREYVPEDKRDRDEKLYRFGFT